MKIIIHGGLLETDDQNEIKQIKSSLKEIALKSYEYLKSHGALKTSIYAVALLEDDPLFDAGTGSAIQIDEKIRMSAAICDGHELNMTAVINIEDVKNPVLVAERLLSLDDKVLSGKEAVDFARIEGFDSYNPETEKQRKAFEEKKKSNRHGTVGCVVIDSNSYIAAATSTGGLGAEMAGRVADTPTVAGNYANGFCGVSCTGTGEHITNNALAAKIVTRVTDGFTIKDAFKKSIDELKAADGDAGAIGIDKSGDIYVLSSKAKVTFATYDGDKLELFEE